ncbi:MAG: cobalamin-binding protein [Planctomycetes bacterium]|nr:cobalamin-binding protein [Planctomycetota bacterium]
MTGPHRIVCLTEETTETLYRMGEQDRIVGISAFTVRPPEARKEKPVVSQFIRARIDRILELKPDLVLGFSDLQADLCADLIRRGLEVHCFNQRTVSGILRMVRTLGSLIGRPEKGEALADVFEHGLEVARAKARRLPARPRVYFEEWPDPIITGIQWVSELIEIAGGEDCFSDLRERGLARDRIVSAEAVLNRKPDLYLASWCGKKFRPKEALARPGFKDAPFTRAGRMVEIPSSLILQPGPACLTDGLAALQKEIRRAAAEMAETGSAGP